MVLLLVLLHRVAHSQRLVYDHTFNFNKTISSLKNLVYKDPVFIEIPHSSSVILNDVNFGVFSLNKIRHCYVVYHPCNDIRSNKFIKNFAQSSIEPFSFCFIYLRISWSVVSAVSAQLIWEKRGFLFMISTAETAKNNDTFFLRVKRDKLVSV